MLSGMRAFITLLLLMLLPTVYAAPELRLNNVYYTVAGDTAEDLWADVLARSPIEQHGRKHVAYTRWQVNWRFWWQNNGESCDISKVDTRLDVTYTLPRLETSPGIPDAVGERWERYYAALVEHEQGHKDLGVKAAREIEQRLSAMGPRDDCRQLELDANTMATKVIERYREMEQAYDRSTNHGLNTGVVFP